MEDFHSPALLMVLHCAAYSFHRFCHFSEIVATLRIVVMKVRNRNHSLAYLSSLCLYYTQKNITVITGYTQLLLLFCM